MVSVCAGSFSPFLWQAAWQLCTFLCTMAEDHCSNHMHWLISLASKCSLSSITSLTCKRARCGRDSECVYMPSVLALARVHVCYVYVYLQCIYMLLCKCMVSQCRYAEAACPHHVQRISTPTLLHSEPHGRSHDIRRHIITFLPSSTSVYITCRWSNACWC